MPRWHGGSSADFAEALRSVAFHDVGIREYFGAPIGAAWAQRRDLSSWWPARGTVRFLGRAWSEIRSDQANALRGRIGHVLRRNAWIPHLNLLLPQLHHTRRPYASPELGRDQAVSKGAFYRVPTARRFSSVWSAVP
jgi:hypothetical protein